MKIFTTVVEARRTANGYVAVLGYARVDANNVLSQWEGVDIDWSDVRNELDAHWDAAPTSEEGLSDDPDYRDLVTAEIEHLRQLRA